MKNLNAYVAKANQWNAIFKGEQYTTKTSEGRRRIAERIDADLSPENLTCDGELPRSVVQAKYRELTLAAQELIQLDPSVAKFMYEFSGE